MICGGDQDLDTCQGDSGGPLIANIDGKFTVVGLTSWGKGCGRLNSPGVFSDLSHPSMMNFINKYKNGLPEFSGYVFADGASI